MKSPSAIERFVIVADRLEARLRFYWASLMASERAEFRTFLGVVREQRDGLGECASLLQLDFGADELARKLKPFATFETDEVFTARLPELAVLQMLLFPRAQNMLAYFGWLRALIEVHALRETLERGTMDDSMGSAKIMAKRGFELVSRIERDGVKFCQAFGTDLAVRERRAA